MVECRNFAGSHEGRKLLSLGRRARHVGVHWKRGAERFDHVCSHQAAVVRVMIELQPLESTSSWARAPSFDSLRMFDSKQVAIASAFASFGVLPYLTCCVGPHSQRKDWQNDNFAYIFHDERTLCIDNRAASGLGGLLSHDGQRSRSEKEAQEQHQEVY